MPPLQENRFHPREACLRLAIPAMAVSFIFLFASLSALLLESVATRFFSSLLEKSWFSWLLSSVSMYAIAMPLSLVIYRIEPPTPPQKKPLTVPQLLGLTAICFLLVFCGNLLGTAVNALISAISGKPVVNPLESMTLSSPLWANLLFAGILAPIMEEIFYRKLIIDRLLPFGELPAVLLSGLLFGLIHGNFSQFFYAAMIGILLGYVYVRTGNILYTIGLHMCVNLVGGVYSAEMLKRLDLEALLENPGTEALSANAIGIAMLLLYSLFMTVALAGGVIALVLFRKKIRFQKAALPLTPRQWALVLGCNPAFWLLAVILVILFAT